jgi:tetratricopeptide (TPR) repeat protein
MKKTHCIIILIFGTLSLPALTIAQEEKESAEIYLEAYSDAFQELFFDALKEKAIENYDKAIHLLLECQKLQPENAVIDYELGKNHVALQRYAEAEPYFKNAIEKDPENNWYLEALFNLYTAQNNEAKAIGMGKQLTKKNPKYKENVAELYAKNKRFKEAIQLLDELDKELGASTQRKNQRLRYSTMMNSASANEKILAEDQKQNNKPLEAINNTIEHYQKTADYKSLLTFINETLEAYPAHSKFYYIKGKTLNQLQKYPEAIPFLETALDFLVDDASLENNIYKELLLAYQATRNTKKAQEYQKKIKNGI